MNKLDLFKLALLPSDTEKPINNNAYSTLRVLGNAIPLNKTLVDRVDSVDKTDYDKSIYDDLIPMIEDIQLLKEELSEVLVRFDTSPNFYTKQDYFQLLKVLNLALIYLYTKFDIEIVYDWSSEIDEKSIPWSGLVKETFKLVQDAINKLNTDFTANIEEIKKIINLSVETINSAITALEERINSTIESTKVELQNNINNIDVTKLIDIKYEDLRKLCKENKLLIGKKYRIIDYQTIIDGNLGAEGISLSNEFQDQDTLNLTITILPDWTGTAYIEREPAQTTWPTLYLQGLVNGWSAEEDWKFISLDGIHYELNYPKQTEKVLYGQFKIGDKGFTGSNNYGFVDTTQITANTKVRLFRGAGMLNIFLNLQVRVSSISFNVRTLEMEIKGYTASYNFDINKNYNLGIIEKPFTESEKFIPLIYAGKGVYKLETYTLPNLKDFNFKIGDKDFSVVDYGNNRTKLNDVEQYNLTLGALGILFSNQFAEGDKVSIEVKIQKDWNAAIYVNNYEPKPVPPKPEWESLYLRGDINEWGVQDEYKFFTRDGVEYFLKEFNKPLFGYFKIADANWTELSTYGFINQYEGLTFDSDTSLLEGSGSQNMFMSPDIANLVVDYISFNEKTKMIYVHKKQNLNSPEKIVSYGVYYDLAQTFRSAPVQFSIVADQGLYLVSNGTKEKLNFVGNGVYTLKYKVEDASNFSFKIIDEDGLTIDYGTNDLPIYNKKTYFMRQGNGLRSANNQFDIVVNAISSYELSEDALVLPSKTNKENPFGRSKLNLWKIKYNISNNEMYDWAIRNGKGVIYYMKDENGNVCDYDFKNILIKGRDDKFLNPNCWYYTFTRYEGENLGVYETNNSLVIPTGNDVFINGKEYHEYRSSNPLFYNESISNLFSDRLYTPVLMEEWPTEELCPLCAFNELTNELVDIDFLSAEAGRILPPNYSLEDNSIASGSYHISRGNINLNTFEDEYNHFDYRRKTILKNIFIGDCFYNKVDGKDITIFDGSRNNVILSKNCYINGDLNNINLSLNVNLYYKNKENTIKGININLGILSSYNTINECKDIVFGKDFYHLNRSFNDICFEGYNKNVALNTDTPRLSHVTISKYVSDIKINVRDEDKMNPIRYKSSAEKIIEI